jgi:8-oxo-dGTP pyrophosphatase MutT (NUDIX family)
VFCSGRRSEASARVTTTVGFGGKVEEKDRSVEEAAKRELREEAGIEALDCAKVGDLTFHFDDQPLPWRVHVFSCSQFEGTPTETEEMSPQWFDESEIPLDKMWADDKHWYPLFLAGKHFEGTFHFKDTHTLVKHELTEVAAFAATTK